MSRSELSTIDSEPFPTIEREFFDTGAKTPDGCVDIDDFVAGLEKDPGLRAELAEARQALGREVYPEENTLASLRLREGLSQSRLAELIGTSQSHIARMESGKDVQASTMKKLANALGVEFGVIADIVQRSLKD